CSHEMGKARSMKAYFLSLAFAALLCLGCGSSRESPMAKVTPSAKQAVDAAAAEAPNNLNPVAGGLADQAANAPVEPLPRKIIRSADVRLIVDDFGQAEQKLR